MDHRDENYVVNERQKYFSFLNQSLQHMQEG